ncbi:MAG: CpsD/CapB family tyrosine-protein kinase [Clostridiales bacterium]|nr:CpsD/CapB family tyrosine-protein kinase [Clostridiales bacterium]
MKRIEIRRFAPLSYAGQEAINTLCTNLSFSGANMKRIMITSSHASEGKSFLTMNIMRTMAQYGKRVVLVDADLRRSYITSRYGLRFEDEQSKWGLAHLLAGMTDKSNVIYSTNISGAYIVPIGREVSNPLPLLNTDHFGELLSYLAAHFDYVLVDAPPVGLVIDAAEIAKSCDGTLIAVNYNAVRRQELIDVKEQIEQTGCPIIGAVLNKVEFDNYLSRKYYKSYYSHYDKKETDGKRGKTKTNNKVAKK